MLGETTCFRRKCKHFQGVKSKYPENYLYHEVAQFNYCKAFPEGIPGDIAYGNDKHLKPLPEQENDIVFEKKGD